MRHERARLDPRDRLPDVVVQVPEGLGRPRRLDAGLLLDAGLELVVGEREHAAVGVVDEDDLACAQQPLADGQRADLVLGHHPARVPDHVRLPVGQAEDLVDVEPGVHAGDHRDPARWRQGQRALKRVGVSPVVLQ
jgi:hypothetical protein